MRSYQELLNHLVCEKTNIYEFLKNPSKLLQENNLEAGSEEGEKIMNLYKKLDYLVENVIHHYTDRPEARFRSNSVKNEQNEHLDKDSSDQECVNGPEHCIYSSGECSDWNCPDSYQCTDTGDQCRYENCVNADSGNTCHTTDEQACLDNLCSNIVSTGKFCVDNTNCIDSQCHDLHCGDTEICTDENQCTNMIECRDGDTGGCSDSDCINGSLSGATECTDSATCIDDISCTNRGDTCTDSEGCRDDFWMY